MRRASCAATLTNDDDLQKNPAESMRGAHGLDGAMLMNADILADFSS